MKKGFTLIELLAVIIILAIILTIATPRVTNMIEGSKIESLKLSTASYIEAVENTLYTYALDDIYDNLTGTYVISNNGKTLTKGEDIINLNYTGEAITSGKLIIEKGNVIKIINGVIDGYYAILTNGKKVELTKELPEGKTLVSGNTFVATIKNLVNGVTNAGNMTMDTATKYIGFYAYGELPNGYTKEQLLALESKSVSSDSSINAYHDGNGNVYVYSDYGIKLNKDSAHMFRYFTGLTELYLDNLDTSAATNMGNMFQGCTSLLKLDLTNFDTSNVTNMGAMFYNCNKLRFLDLTNFNTQKVTSMNQMFLGTSNLARILVGDGWTGSAINGTLFTSKSFLTEVTHINDTIKNYLLSGSSFNAKIKNFVNNSTSFAYNTGDSKVKSLGFYSNGNLPEGYTKEQLETLPSIDVSGVLDNSIKAYYDGNGNVYIYSDTEIYAPPNSQTLLAYFGAVETMKLDDLNTSSVVNMSSLFEGDSKFITLDLKGFDTSKVTNMYGVFKNCKKLEQLDLTNFNTERVTSLSYMFYQASSLKQVNLTSFNINKVTTMDSMFRHTGALDKVIVSDNWVVGESTNVGLMFDNSSIKHVTLNTDSVMHLTVAGQSINTRIKNLVNNKTNLNQNSTDSKTKSIGFYANGALPEGYTIDELKALPSTDISILQDGSILAYNDNGNVYIYSEEGISLHSTSSYLFRYFTALENVSFNGLDTSHVSTTLEMFNGCTSLTSLDLTNFDITYVTNMNKMFYGTSALEEVLVNSKWKDNTSATTTDIYTNSGIESVTEQ